MANLSDINAEHAVVDAFDLVNKSFAFDSARQSLRLDEVSTILTYVGTAIIGSAEGSAVWQIKRISISGTVTSIKYADGNSNYDNIWANRAALTYT